MVKRVPQVSSRFHFETSLPLADRILNLQPAHKMRSRIPVSFGALLGVETSFVSLSERKNFRRGKVSSPKDPASLVTDQHQGRMLFGFIQKRSIKALK